jgi:hypothetical protein
VQLYDNAAIMDVDQLRNTARWLRRLGQVPLGTPQIFGRAATGEFGSSDAGGRSTQIDALDGQMAGLQ